MTVWLRWSIRDDGKVTAYQRPAPESWPGVPRKGEGYSGSRVYMSVNAKVDRVWWHGDGDVTVYMETVEHPDLGEAPLDEGWTEATD